MKKMVYVFKEIAIIGNIIGYHFSEIKDPSYPGYELELIGTTEIDIQPIKKTVTKEVRAVLQNFPLPGPPEDRRWAIQNLVPQNAKNIRILYDEEEK